MALTAGTLITLAFVLLATGSAFGKTLEDNLLTPVWGFARIVLAANAPGGRGGAVFRWCPHRRQPGWSWLALGRRRLRHRVGAGDRAPRPRLRYSSTFGRAYESLAGIVALLLWALLSSVAMLFGASVAAELEAVRASRRED